MADDIEARLDFKDLQARGIVKSRSGLRNAIKKHGFPPGKLTGPNSRTWGAGEIREYVADCPSEPKAAYAAKHPDRRPRGRPKGSRNRPKPDINVTT